MEGSQPPDVCFPGPHFLAWPREENDKPWTAAPLHDAVESERTRQFWCAVLSRALDDACGAFGDLNGDTSSSAQRLQLEAKDWFRSGRAAFREVCWLAGLDPDVIQVEAMKRIQLRGPMRDLRKCILHRW